MKYFEKDSKHNFVDENNVFVGYDSYQSCCESADWSLFESVPEPDVNYYITTKKDLPGYVFDINFFEEVVLDGLDSGRAVLFRLTKAGEKDMYLCLWNCHNGYYSHGLEVTHNGINIRYESL